MSTNYLETIKMLVLIWLRLERAADDARPAGDVLPLQGIQLSRRLGYIVHTERTLSNAARAFMQLLDQASAEGQVAQDG